MDRVCICYTVTQCCNTQTHAHTHAHTVPV